VLGSVGGTERIGVMEMMPRLLIKSIRLSPKLSSTQRSTTAIHVVSQSNVRTSNSSCFAESWIFVFIVGEDYCSNRVTFMAEWQFSRASSSPLRTLSLEYYLVFVMMMYVFCCMLSARSLQDSITTTHRRVTIYSLLHCMTVKIFIKEKAVFKHPTKCS
jgi:hypothetical protein